MSAPVALDGVSVRLGGTTILDHLSLEISAGSWVSMIGPNGAGKTTVLRCITGAVPHQGTVQIGSAAVAEMQVREVARMVAIVPQHPTLPEGMRVVDYVLLGRTPHRGSMTSESEHDLLLVGQVLETLPAGSCNEWLLPALSLRTHQFSSSTSRPQHSISAPSRRSWN